MGKFSDYSDAGTLGGGEVLGALQGGVMKKTTVDAVLERRKTLENFGAILTHSTVQVITDSTWTVVDFDTEVEDDGSLHDPGSSTKIIIPAGKGGTYLISALLTFASDATGTRKGRIVVGASPKSLVHQAAINGEDTTVMLNRPLKLAAGAELTLEVWQSSGGNLNISGSEQKLIFAAELLRLT